MLIVDCGFSAADARHEARVGLDSNQRPWKAFRGGLFFVFLTKAEQTSNWS